MSLLTLWALLSLLAMSSAYLGMRVERRLLPPLVPHLPARRPPGFAPFTGKQYRICCQCGHETREGYRFYKYIPQNNG